MTRCQYYQIHPSEGLPPRDTVKPLKGRIHRLLQDLDLESIAIQSSLESKWDELVGQPLAAHSRPGSVENGALTLYVKSPTWKFEIDRHLGVALLAKLRQKLPDLQICRLVIRMDPGRFERPEPGTGGNSHA